MALKIAFAGTGYINKVHVQAAQNLGFDLAAVVNHKIDSMVEFGKRFDITRQYESVDALLKDGNVDALVLSNAKDQQLEEIDSGFEFPRKNHTPQSLYDAQLRYFAECIEKNQTPIPGGLEGWTNMKVVDAAYESSRTGKVVEIR